MRDLRSCFDRLLNSSTALVTAAGAGSVLAVLSEGKDVASTGEEQTDTITSKVRIEVVSFFIVDIL
jgi:hypothetical protein